MYDIYIYICVCVGWHCHSTLNGVEGGEENPGYDNTPKMKFEYWLNLKANKILGQIKSYWYKRVLRITLPVEKEIEILLFIFPRCTANMDSIVWFWHRSKMDGFCSVNTPYKIPKSVYHFAVKVYPLAACGYYPTQNFRNEKKTNTMHIIPKRPSGCNYRIFAQQSAKSHQIKKKSIWALLFFFLILGGK